MTQEKLLAEAQELAKMFTPCEPTDDPYESSVQSYTKLIADFALSQLRAAKESGHLRHKFDCAAINSRIEQRHDVMIIHTGEYGPCSCGFAERFGEL